MLHQMNIIHGDIHNNNIMWSHHNKKHVLMDFGISLFIKEKIGEKSFSSFRGTYLYCY